MDSTNDNREPVKADGASALRYAQSYHKRGFLPVPLPLGQKRPIIKNWQNLRLAKDDLPDYFSNGQNLGLLLGQPSGNLIDVDLDCEYARRLAPAVLPATPLTSGRASALQSHHWYFCEIGTKKFQDPDCEDGSKAMVVEIRSTGTQTLVAPSIHPSGERYEWDSRDDPADVMPAELLRSVSELAAAALLARHWIDGKRHQLALAFGSTLLRHGWGRDEVEYFIVCIARAAGDLELSDRRDAVHTTAHRLAENKRCTGIPTLENLLPAKTLEKILEWLAIPQTLSPHERNDPVQKMPARLFTRRSMTEWLTQAADKPVPLRLFGNFISEGELSILFGDTGEGKSALAVQVGNDIASGYSSTGLAVEASRGVLYFDFELSDVQQLRRYAEEHINGDGRKTFLNVHEFHPKFHRVEVNGASALFDNNVDWERLLLAEIERVIVESGHPVVIIDNITWLGRETDKGKFALPLMQRLCDLKREHHLTGLVLAHTPKRPERDAISLNHLAGSKILANFADGVFAIGRSIQNAQTRYLKQLKVRSSEVVYTGENVAVFRFGKVGNFLGFKFISSESERDHLKVKRSDEDTRAVTKQQAQLLSLQGRTQREIAEQLGISLGVVNKYVHAPRPVLLQFPPRVHDVPGREQNEHVNIVNTREHSVENSAELENGDKRGASAADLIESQERRLAAAGYVGVKRAVLTREEIDEILEAEASEKKEAANETSSSVSAPVS